jgi:hypothetical protein
MVWVGSAASLDAHQADLDGWAASRQVRVEQPYSEPPLPSARHDDALAERIEGLLGDAQAEAFSTEGSAAKKALDAAEELLESSADLPESPWLMAEIYRARAALVAASDPAAAAVFERKAAALSGPRAVSFASVAREAAAPRKPGTVAPAPLAEPAPSAGPAVALEGPLPSDDVDVDGVEVAYPRTIPDGSHHVRVTRAGRLAWTGWITAAGTEVRVAVPKAHPCSDADLGATDVAAHAVACEYYARARPVGPERIEVSLCHGASCGPWLPWSRTWGATFEGPVHSPRAPRAGHAWIPWTIAGVGAAILGGFVLVESGAFDRRGPTRETYNFVPAK